MIPVTRLNYNLCPLYMPNATVYYIVNLEIYSNLFKKTHSSTFLFVNALQILFYQVKEQVLTQSLYIVYKTNIVDNSEQEDDFSAEISSVYVHVKKQ